jgi:hypothetical protein
VFLDESIFNEKTGWRHQAYAPIGSNLRYHEDVRRGKTWSICAALTVNGYLPCTSIREGYFNTNDFVHWLETELMPALSLTERTMVIVLNNCSTHISDRIREVVEAGGHIIRYLPLCSPDFNPIELTFSVIKV